MPLGILALGVRAEMGRIVAREHAHRLAAATGIIEGDLAREHRRTTERLDAVAAELASDSRFRLGVNAADPAARAWLLDYAGQTMRAAGLDFLQLQDRGGRVISSGHFRNEYDRIAPRPVADSAGQGVIVQVRTPSESMVAFGAVDSFTVAGDSYTAVGGVALDSARLATLARTPGLEIELALPGMAVDTGRAVYAMSIPFEDLTGNIAQRGTAQLTIIERTSPLGELQRRVDRWFLLALAGTLLLALMLASWLSARISRPIRELSSRTAALDLERLDQDFASDRTDEIGELSRLLGAMTQRLRSSTMRLREAERRAAIGDMSRQVNHDIKNGLVPIRHVVRHLTDVAEKQPDELADVFQERRGTLESSIRYLEDLARSYAQLGPAGEAGVTGVPGRSDRMATDLGVLIREVAANLSTESVSVTAAADEDLPPVAGDPIAIRRIVENLAGNAVDSFEGRSGTVTITAERGTDGRHVRLVVADTGRGMTREELDRAFTDFATTKPGGTGLGLSVVRRLISDLGGTLRATTEPGAGSRFTVELPVRNAG